MSNQFDLVNNMAATIMEGATLTEQHVSGGTDLMASCLPEDLTIDQVEASERFITNYGAASLIATARVMAENNLESITSSFETPCGSIEHTVDKDIQIAGEVKPVYAVTAFNRVSEGKEDVLAYATDVVANIDFGNGDLEADA